MFKKLIKAIDNLADAIDSLVEKLDTVIRVVNTVGTSIHVERIAGSNPAVQKALGIQEAEPGKPMNTRRRWTAKEDSIVIIGYSKGLAPAAISEILKQQGFDRSAHAIVDHMSELRKLMK